MSGCSHAASRISSFDQKPDSGGTPAIASQPTMNVTAVIGMAARRAPMRRMSCSSPMPWMTEPEPKNSSPLKKACVTTWKMAATYAPEPMARNM